MDGTWPKQIQFQLLELSKVGDCRVGVDLNTRGLGKFMGLKRSSGKSYSRGSPQVILRDLTVFVLIRRALSRNLGSTYVEGDPTTSSSYSRSNLAK